MLGSVKSERSWKWTACGKHPSAGDYFKFGNDDLMVREFTGWIEDGYHQLLLSSPKRSRLCSWRFWVKGQKKNAIVCGICRDSSDRMGRPFPLIVIGKGKVPGWEDHWDLLPLIFENIWSRTGTGELPDSGRQQITGQRPGYAAGFISQTRFQGR